MSKNIYFFGDSFTLHIPTEDNERGGFEYKETLPNEFVHWTHQVSNHLNIPTNHIIDKSRSGMSTQEIFNKCLSTSNKMKKGDWVIISDSPPIRQLGYNHLDKEIQTINNEPIYDVRYVNFIEEMKGRIKKQSSLNQNFNNENEKNSYVDYLYYFVRPNLHHWESFYRKQIIDLLYLLKSKEINCIFWSWQLWKNYIFTPWHKEWKKGDDHWGYIGHNEFAEYLKKRIDNKNMVSEVEWKNPKSLVKKLL
tara:strand:- start:3429 stop:4178 length:750 start_codon:yes stop_codon:yes gene_type:complete